MILEEELSPRIAEPNEVISHYNIKKEDIDKVKDWLLSNKENGKFYTTYFPANLAFTESESKE